MKNLIYNPSDSIGPVLLPMLGIPVEGCRRAVIEFEAGKAVIVTAEYYAKMDVDADTTALKTEIRKFSLVELTTAEKDPT